MHFLHSSCYKWEMFAQRPRLGERHAHVAMLRGQDANQAYPRVKSGRMVRGARSYYATVRDVRYFVWRWSLCNNRNAKCRAYERRRSVDQFVPWRMGDVFEHSRYTQECQKRECSFKKDIMTLWVTKTVAFMRGVNNVFPLNFRQPKAFFKLSVPTRRQSLREINNILRREICSHHGRQFHTVRFHYDNFKI